MSHDNASLVADHGSQKQAEPTDPLEPRAGVVPGNADYLVRCFVEEFASIGYDGAAILALFRDPRYSAVHVIYRQRGEEAVRELIGEVLAECGVMQVTVETPRRRPRQLVQIEVADDSIETPGEGVETGDHGASSPCDGEVPGDGRKEDGR